MAGLTVPHRREMAELPVSHGGVFVISIDVELAWGYCDLAVGSHEREGFGKEREASRRLLDLFGRYNIRATWAIVAHLLLDNAPRKNGRAHPGFPRPVIKGESRDWFDSLPQGPNEAWYARDLVEMIRAAKPTQEIASHSFCHVIFDEGSTQRNAIEADLRLAKSLHQEAGLPFETFVFPRDQVGFRDLLVRAGILVYRDRTRRWYDYLRPAPLRRLGHLLHYVLGIPPRPVRASIDRFGLVRVPDSMHFLRRDGLRRWVPGGRQASMASRGLSKAASEASIFHLWLHPLSLAFHMEEQLAEIESILSHARALRTAGRLQNLTLQEIGSRVRSGME